MCGRPTAPPPDCDQHVFERRRGRRARSNEMTIRSARVRRIARKSRSCASSRPACCRVQPEHVRLDCRLRRRSARSRQRRAHRALLPSSVASARPSTVSWSVSASRRETQLARGAHHVARRARAIRRGGVRVEIDERESTPVIESARVIRFRRCLARLRLRQQALQDRRPSARPGTVHATREPCGE